MSKNTVSTLKKHLNISPAGSEDYEQLARFHYQNSNPGPVLRIYKIVDGHPWRRLAAPVVGIIVYGAPSANLAVRNRATGWVFAGLDRSAALTLLNERMLCIRRVIIDPKYRGLGLASWLESETLGRVGVPMVEAISVMARMHRFFERAGMVRFTPSPDAKTERMKAAFNAVGLDEAGLKNARDVHAAIEALSPPLRAFVTDEMNRFCQKFTNRRILGHSHQRTEFVLSKLTDRSAYYLWICPQPDGKM